MGVSRRNFLHWGGFLAMGATMSAFGQRGIRSDHSGEGNPGNTVHAVPPVGTPHGGHPDLRHMTKESFAPYVGTGFKISQGTSQPVWIRLMSAEQFPANPQHQHEISVASTRKTSTYRLRFLGSSEKVLPQGSYTLEHDKLGTIKLLLVPSGDGQQLYTAIVTHLQ
jgi:hypothetical protein